MNNDKSRFLIRIVDDDEALRISLAFLLEAEGWDVKTFADAREFLSADSCTQPGCLVLDVRMPGMTGPELQRELIARGSVLPVVFLTGHGDMEMAVDAMKRGAVDFIAKPIDPEKFVTAIRSALQHQMRSAAGVPAGAEAVSRWNALTEREKEICSLLASGLLNRETAERLSISERTVEGHRASAFRKLSIRTVKELALLLESLRTAGI